MTKQAYNIFVIQVCT